MSSDLKDARWQLAYDMAEEDGFDPYSMGFYMKAGYLDTAQERLDSASGQEMIEQLAKRWREEGEK